MKEYKLALHIFRRDLRLDDNTALIDALDRADLVNPCFIVDTRQLIDNAYRSDNALQDLQAQFSERSARLYLFYGIPEEVVEKLLSSLEIDLVTWNRDYTPLQREGMKRMINKIKVNFNRCVNIMA